MSTHLDDCVVEIEKENGKNGDGDGDWDGIVDEILKISEGNNGILHKDEIQGGNGDGTDDGFDENSKTLEGLMGISQDEPCSSSKGAMTTQDPLDDYVVKIEKENGYGKGSIAENFKNSDSNNGIPQKDDRDTEVEIKGRNGDRKGSIDETLKTSEGENGILQKDDRDSEVEIEEGNGDGNGGGFGENSKTLEDIMGLSQDEPCSSSKGSVDRNLPEPKFTKMENSTEGNLEPNVSRPTRIVKNRQNDIRRQLFKKFLDEKVPQKKKLKWLNRFAIVQDDGTVQFEVPCDIKPPRLDFGTGVVYDPNTDKPTADTEDTHSLRPLQFVMLIVGTRGDVQPFVAIGKRLQDDGHRVRLATHANFKEFVRTAGLEFFPLGGDPKVLAAYMVKNKGFLPSGPSEIQIQRNQIKDIVFSLLPACVDPDPDSNIPFKVDAIIANPPAYGHTHVAEALNVPLHIIFTMPWTPTSEFPHPLSRVTHQVGYKLSYQIVDGLIWLGVRDVINEFRKKKLHLRPKTYLAAPYGSSPNIPYAYIWSPHLVPKPKDWGPNIDVVGFCFLDLASNYVPPDSLVKWLEDGEQPVYVGFGSLPVQEPEKMTEIIVRALELTGQRGIINKGWGGLGNLKEPKESIYLLDNCPHDWLFPRCAAVVHHGGAGTTAAGLKASLCLSLETNRFGESGCMPGESDLRLYPWMNSHYRNWLMLYASC